MHPNVKNILGQRFGKLVVKSEFGRNHKRMVVWTCECDCGKITTRQGSTLISGKSFSCGCTKHSSESNIKRAITQRRPGAAQRKQFSHCQAGAAHRGHSWNLSFEQFILLSLQKCYYCGALPSSIKSTKYESYLSNGIDRLNNSIGYEPENCVPACKVCNYMKRALSEQEFLEHVFNISSYQSRKLERVG